MIIRIPLRTLETVLTLIDFLEVDYLSLKAWHYNAYIATKSGETYLKVMLENVDILKEGECCIPREAFYEIHKKYGYVVISCKEGIIKLTFDDKYSKTFIIKACTENFAFPEFELVADRSIPAYEIYRVANHTPVFNASLALYCDRAVKWDKETGFGIYYPTNLTYFPFYVNFSKKSINLLKEIALMGGIIKMENAGDLVLVKKDNILMVTMQDHENPPYPNFELVCPVLAKNIKYAVAKVVSESYENPIKCQSQDTCLFFNNFLITSIFVPYSNTFIFQRAGHLWNFVKNLDDYEIVYLWLDKEKNILGIGKPEAIAFTNKIT